MRLEESQKRMERREEAYRQLREESTDVLKLWLGKCVNGFAILGLDSVKWMKLDSLERRLMSAKTSGSVGHKQIVEPEARCAPVCRSYRTGVVSIRLEYPE
ncbi:hypothetical protein AXG93_4201s1250 [Marchantia polymorpha subsp. ruderalis]|uniref:Uncharacterized protein n=1 Tax=Marchantia polymorpha subsp. ruderalis TaxID=1480154 RepID=A0A176WBL1_MARPO|nr:hypothetical protein AXG93_4201s1250 [Marchantia polymorpha subsp. ruderalis]